MNTTLAVQAQTDEAPTADARQRLLQGLPVRERRLVLANIPTTVLEGGDGPPIVLLHGPGEHAAKWLRVIPSLVATHRVIAPDLPGHGASPVPGGNIEIDRIFNWLDQMLDRTCTEPPILVGQIIGGAIAARFAFRNSRRIKQLVLVDTLGLCDFHPDEDFGAALTAFLAQPSPASHDRLWQHCAYDLDALRNTMSDQWESLKAYNLDRAADPQLAVTQQQLFEQFGLSRIPDKELATITAPVSLIWGQNDLATRLSVAEDASKRFNWPLQVIRNAGDDPPVERPAEFLAALRRVLANEQ